MALKLLKHKEEKVFKLKIYIFCGVLCYSGGIDHVEEESERNVPELPKKDVEVAGAADDRDSRIQAARERFLARKGKK